MKTEEHDDLWQLLGKARQPVHAPFLSRNVLREIRGMQQEPRVSWLSFFFRWQPLVATVCLSAMVAGGWVATNRRQAEEQKQLLAMAQLVYTSPDFAVIANLDDLLDSEKNAAWLGGDLN